MIVITGATGALNGATVDHLLERVPAAEVAVVTRDAAKAHRFAERGVEVRQGDYAEPAGLPDAFRGADQLLLVSSNDPHADAVALHRGAIAAAGQAGVGRILYTSHQNTTTDSAFHPARVHGATEQALAASGIPWTSLRNGFYAHSLAWLTGPWQQSGTIAVPGDGPVSWTAREDEAQAAAVILTADDPVDGPITLTAGAAPTFADIAAVASELAGREIGYAVLPPDEWVAQQVQNGADEARSRFMLGFYEAAARGEFAEVDPRLGQLLGREPLGVRDVLAEVAPTEAVRGT